MSQETENSKGKIVSRKISSTGHEITEAKLSGGMQDSPLGGGVNAIFVQTPDAMAALRKYAEEHGISYEEAQLQFLNSLLNM